jgi:hypothetical protein
VSLAFRALRRSAAQQLPPLFPLPWLSAALRCLLAEPRSGLAKAPTIARGTALRPLSSLVAIAVMVMGSTGSGAERAKAEALGTAAGAWAAWLNGQPLAPGTAVFSGDAISTGKGGIAVIRLVSGNSAAIGETSIATFFSRTASGTDKVRTGSQAGDQIHLGHGLLTVRSDGRWPTQVSLAQAAVTLEGQPGFPSLCRVASAGPYAVVVADRGHVRVQRKGASIVLRAGESARLAAGGPQGEIHIAGEVVDSMPEEVVLHPDEQVEIALGLGQLVNVGDAIRTLAAGRIRIQLISGPYLNLGPRSVFKITAHNPESHYTRLELRRGYLRAEAARVANPGIDLEVRTSEAVISGAGGTFVVGALGKETEACAIDGTIRVRALNASGFVTVPDNQCTRVVSGSDPIPPRELTRRLETAMYLTTVVGTAVGGPPVPRPSPAAIGAAAGDGTAALLDAIGLILIGDARSSLGRADSRLGSAGNNLGNAASAAQAATQEAEAASAALQNLLNGLKGFSSAVSPSTP